VHAETVRVVDEQIKDLDTQMHDLDDFVARARAENGNHHEQHSESMKALSTTVHMSFSNISTHFKQTFDRVEILGDAVEDGAHELRQTLPTLEQTVCEPLLRLRGEVLGTTLREYEPTGATPEKTQYNYPTEVPRTDAHDVLIAGLTDASTPTKPAPVVFSDVDSSEAAKSPPPAALENAHNPLNMSLREVNPNLTTGSIMFDPSASTMSLPQDNHTLPLFRRSARQLQAPKKHTKGRNVVTLEGRENLPPTAFSQSTSRRKSPRLH
jgi:kinesin family member 11